MIDVNGHISSVERRVGGRTLAAGEARTVTIARVFDTSPEDLWDACTDPERISRWFLPVSGRLYFRKSQRPYRCGSTGPKEEFRTKCVLAVDLIREQARRTGGKHLAVFDGGFALRSVVRPLVAPEAAGGAKTPPRVEFLTRLRHDARL